jgi:glycerol-3-phosphate dehydrogenase (NAD+)
MSSLAAAGAAVAAAQLRPPPAQATRPAAPAPARGGSSCAAERRWPGDASSSSSAAAPPPAAQAARSRSAAHAAGASGARRDAPSARWAAACGGPAPLGAAAARARRAPQRRCAASAAPGSDAPAAPPAASSASPPAVAAPRTGAVLRTSPEERQSVKESWDKILRWARFTTQREATEVDVLAATHKVVILGGGSFGTAMATLLARNKASLDVVLLVRDAATVTAINERHCNERYLPTHTLPPNVRASTDAGEAISGADYIVHAIPVQQSSAALAALRNVIPPSVPILCLSKGLEIGTCHNMSELIPIALGRKQPLAVLSGPSFAIELMQGLPTAIVAASEDAKLASRVQRLFASSNLRVNTSTDVIGVETAGALKNVLAIAAGIVEGLSLGNNAMAALVAQGCSEIRWLAERMGAEPVTLSGLSGVGDIMLTCFVPLSRNRTVGVRLGRGETLEAILASSTQVAEGVATAGAVVVLARKHRVALPVLTAVARIVDGEMSPREAVETVMALPQIPEV